MKIRIIFLSMLVIGLSISACNVNGQAQNKLDRERIDSMQKADSKIHKQMDNAKTDRKESEVRTKEAKHVEQNASDASAESRKALKAEKKAQRSRQKADEQASKTKSAVEKSDRDRKEGLILWDRRVQRILILVTNNIGNCFIYNTGKKTEGRLEVFSNDVPFLN